MGRQDSRGWAEGVVYCRAKDQVRTLQRNWAGFYYADTADRRGSGYGAKWEFMVATALGQASRLAALGGPGQQTGRAGST